MAVDIGITTERFADRMRRCFRKETALYIYIKVVVHFYLRILQSAVKYAQ